MRFTNLLTLLAATSALSYTIKRDELDDKINQISQAIENNGGDMDKLSQVLENNGGDINELNQALANNGGDVDINQLSQALGGNNDLEKVADSLTDNKTNGGNASNINPSTIFNEDCAKVSQDYINCFGNGMQTSQEEACNTFNSEKCQSLLKQDFSACGKELGSIYDLTIASLIIGCAKDENGNKCLQSEAISSKKGTSSSKGDTSLKNDDIKEICKSSVCTEKAIDGLTRIKKITDSLEGSLSAEDKAELDKQINELNKCKPEKSDATQIKVGSALLASLALAIYLF